MMRVGLTKPALRLLLISLAVCGGHAHALGLGAIALQSGLGRPLAAKIPVLGLAGDEAGASCIKSRVTALEGALLARPVAELAGSGAGMVLSLRTTESINEPAVNVTVEIGCSSGVRREYQVLLDPVPATLPMTAPVTAGVAAPAERTQRPARKAVPQAAAAADAPAGADNGAPASGKAGDQPASKAPATLVRKPAAPARTTPPAETKSVLTLAGGDAEIEQVRARLALRSSTVLSEPRIETDPAALARMRADQARVAALLRGEDPLAAVQAQLRDAQGKLLATQKAAANASQLHEQEKAALVAAQDQMVSGKLIAALGALALACIAVIGWLLWQRAADRRRQEQAFFAMTAEQEALADAHVQDPRTAAEPQAAEVPPLPVFEAPAAPVFDPAPDDAAAHFNPPADFAATPAVAGIEVFDWKVDDHPQADPASPPAALDLPASWMLMQAQQPAQDADPAPELPQADSHAHAAEVAGMLLAAESWMAEHNPLRAAELLRPYLDRDEMLSPAPSLYLLNLYRTMDDKGQIATILAQLQQDFPAEAAAWSSTVQTRRSIADYPAVHETVDSLSDSDRLLPYLNSLLLAPEQFDFSTYREIVRAIGLANEMKQENEMQAMTLDFH